MRIFWMHTNEGVRIPVLMTRPGVTVYDINTEAMYADPNATIFNRYYATPSQTQDWFGASDESLYSMVNQHTLYKALAGKGIVTQNDPTGGVIQIGVAPGSILEQPTHSFGQITWTLDDSVSQSTPWTTYGPYGPVFFKTGSSPARYQYFNCASVGTVVSGCYAHRFVKQPGDTSNGRTGGVVALIRDDGGNMKAVSLHIMYTNANDTYRGKVLVSTRNTRTQGSLLTDQTYWQAQTGDIEETDNPNPPDPPEGDGIVNLENRFSPRVKTSALGVYPLTKEQVSSFMQDMWTTGFAEKILYDISGKPMDSVISLKWYYGLKNNLIQVPLQAYLSIGNVVFDGGFGASQSIVTRPCDSEYVTYEFGEVNINRFFNNFLDYSPFTELRLFIPYVGYVDLNINEFIGQKLRVDMNTNITTGISTAMVYASTDYVGDWRLVHSASCNIGVEIPLSVDARENIESRFTTSALGVIGGGVAVAAMPIAGAGVVGGVVSAGLQNAIDAPQVDSGTQQRSGGMDSDSGSLSYLFPFIKITRPTPIAPSNYNTMIGSPDFRTGKIGSYTGYIKVGAIKTNNTSIPKSAMDEIADILKGGVYID